MALSLAGCTAEAPPPTDDDDDDPPVGVSALEPEPQQPAEGVGPSVVLVDSTIAPAIAGQDGWNFEQSAAIDWDGDGAADRAVLTARVELYRGRPAWDDGQPWQVYVEHSGGDRSYLYSRRLQLGTLTMRVGVAEAEEPPSIILLEQLPGSIRLIESTRSVNGGAGVVRFERSLDPTGEIASPQLP